jgi:aldoxime dehydratase
MDSAIAPHLRCPRTRTRRIEDDYKPPYPAWSTHAEPKLGSVVMAYYGFQSKGREDHARACRTLKSFIAGFDGEDGPGHHDLTHYVDEGGYDNMIAIAYWTEPDRFARFEGRTREWWESPDRLTDGIGYFREVVTPEASGFETLFSGPDRMEGIGLALGTRTEDDIQEHGYWGSMRERLAASQTDALSASGALAATEVPGFGKRVKVAGHRNVAMIRSGQDWTNTTGKERELYLGDMEPILRSGMDFLRNNGRAIGCYSNRYMQHMDEAGQPLEKSFGYSYWHSLGEMERWSESHPTHVAIFGTFMRIVQELNFQLDLRLYHEVSVLKPEEQQFEYINCHPRTGLMNGL